MPGRPKLGLDVSSAKTLLPVADARAAVLTAVEGPLGAEPVALSAALGRVLAEDMRAGEDVPGLDNSAMDGYAVRAADTAAVPAPLRIAGESRAGAPADHALGEGEAFRISTGATIPAGADAVVRVEDTEPVEGEEKVRILSAVEAGGDIRRAGEDIRSGDVALRAGSLLGPAELGVLVSLGVPEPRCSRQPRVAIVCTGDELLGAAEPMRPGGVRNSNAEALRALATLAGAKVVAVERCGDDAESTRDASERALGADVAVFSGGVSVGEHDHVKEALRHHGAEERFWGVALRPGKPTWFGVKAGGPQSARALAFGLPGNPVSALVTFVLFVRPALRALAGAHPRLDSTTAMLADRVARMPSRDQAVRCRLELTNEGWLAHPTGHQGSHVLTSMLGADALAVIEAGVGDAPAGEPVRVDLLRVASGAL